MRAIENNIYVDPLTGLPNFFKFIECDTCKLFGEQGTIIIFDLADFMTFNKKYGKDAGDLCLKNLCYAINIVFCDRNSYAFRTDGDEFTIILPHKICADAGNKASSVKSEYKDKMNKRGFKNADIHILIFNYNNGISSIDEFYEIIFTNSSDKMESQNGNAIQQRRLRHIIGNFAARIRETLSFYNDIYNLAITDDTSGLLNQRAARLYLTNLTEECLKTNKQFSLLFIDGDNLKRYNRISYQSGNDMIKRLAGIVSESVRNSDKVFRWLTGDEFLVILEGANYENALEAAERIRVSVEEQTQNCVYPVTVSIGISNFPDDGMDINKIIQKAEEANVAAKIGGKNRIIKANAIA